jgi:type IV pilus assembly protein PilY1
MRILTMKMFDLLRNCSLAKRVHAWIARCAAAAYGTVTSLFLLAVTAPSVLADVSQSPLSVVANVPGNVALTLSVEFPTAVSVAHQGNFVTGKEYVGYFNPSNCYRYVVGGTPANDTSNAGNDVSYFNPVGATTSDYRCTALADTWSGSFLNWMTMQAIDPFRWALTGGYRRVDTDTTTILERAWSPYSSAGMQGSDTNFPIIPSGTRASPTATQIAEHTPWGYQSLKVSVRQRGNELLIAGNSASTTITSSLDSSNPVPAVPNTGTHLGCGATCPTYANNTIYRFYTRVKVCDTSSGGGRERNCKQYASGWKPEGLLQDYSARMRFSALSYLNDPTDDRRDAGVLRAKQKFVGPQVIVPGAAPTDNTNKEWNPVTGVMVTNPDSADASATASAYSVTVPNSGVINYINKFGLERTYKRRDPVAELYYAALRYLKNQGNVSAWMPSTSDPNKTRLIDSFPVISTWNDPIQYQCQNNFILGIGDTNGSWDQNLPGTSSDSGGPAKPAAVSSDTTVNAAAKRDKVRQLNGGAYAFGGDSSDLIAGLAYHAATEDIRPDLPNLPNQPRGQNVQTYWLDVLEFESYLANNQYYMATKFGGLNIPDGTTFNPDTATAATIQNSWWRTTTDTVGGQPRPDNYFTVGNPQAMLTALQRAFARISATSVGSSASLAANSTRLDTDTRTFQAQFSSSWSGDLRSFAVATNGTLSASPVWTASAVAPLSAGNWASRKIYTHDPANNTLVDFTYANLTASQKTAMVSSDVVDYIRGNQTKEESQASGIFRTRVRGLLGDIVNSTPVFVSKPNPNLYTAAMGFPGASTYGTFAAAKSTRTGIVWVGANDGMLHAFNADTGAEVFAFVPKTAIANDLASFASPTYAHKYFVDGDLAVADVYDSGTSSWRTILVGTLGRGGPGVFALDVTTPTAAGISLLWDKSGADIPGGVLGKNIGKPVIAQTASGVWQVLLGNGPDSAAGTAQLVAINVITGATTTVDTGGGGSNGLSAVLARDSDGDRYSDTIYAGDLKGRLLKITNLGGTPTVSTLFTAVDPSTVAQPITAAPLAGKDPATGITWVFFGTGKFISDADPGSTQVQSWYGIQDTGGLTPTRSDLAQRSVLTQAAQGGFTVRTISQGASGDMTGKRGWYLDLPTSGERMVVPNQFQGGALLGTSRIPDSSNVCQPSGRGFIMAINPFTGGRLDQTFFDLNGDGLFNNSDKLVVSGSPVIVSAVGFDSSPNAPIFVENVMQVSLDDGTTRTLRTQGSAVDSRRLTWREIRN